jgi:hypothetical protein
MANIKLIDRIILNEIADVKRILTESVTNWAQVRGIFKKLNLSSINVEGVETYKFNDPKLGIVYIGGDGTAYMEKTDTETNWSFDGTNIIVNNQTLGVTGYVNKPKSNYAVTITDKPVQGRDAIDVFQTALDWLGFIPGYGDILDAINAIIYFARGKYLDGTLSLIAIIPLVGSGIKLSFKGAIQGAGGAMAVSRIWRKAANGSPDDLIKFYREAIASGKLDKVQLAAIAAKGDEIAALLTKGKSYVRGKEAVMSAMGLNATAVLKQLDDVSSLIKNTTSVPIKKSFASKIGAAYDAMKASRIGQGTSNLFQGGANLITFGGFGVAKNLVKKLGISGREMKMLKDAMDVRWVKRISDSPTLTTAMFKTNKRLSAAAASSIGVPPWLSSRPTKEIQEWFANLQKTDPRRWKEVSSTIAQQSADAKNIYYMKFVENAFQQASNIFRPGAVLKGGYPDMFARALKLDSYRLSNPKNLDIVKNEIEDLAEKLGLDPEENANGVIMPAIYSVFSSFLNDTKNKAEDAYEMGLAGTAIATVGAIAGVGDEEQEPTDSIPGSTNVDPDPSSQLSSIKQDFKNADGSTLEKLQALSDIGWSEDDIDVLKKALDIE